MLFRKSRFFSVAHGFQLDNGVPSPSEALMIDYVGCMYVEVVYEACVVIVRTSLFS